MNKRLLKAISFIGVLFFLVGNAKALTGTAYFKNDTLAVWSVRAQEQGPVFGGMPTPPVVTVNPGGTGSSTWTTLAANSIGWYGNGVGTGAGNTCVKYSPVSFAAAKASPCFEGPLYGGPGGSYTTGAGNLGHTNVYVVLEPYVPPQCPAQSFSWGPSSYCTGSAPITAVGSSFALTNTKAGASGSATASCVSGAWQVSGPSCVASMAAPAGLAATDGTVSYGINTAWSTVTGASTYRLQYRVQGSGTWTDLYAGAAAAYNWAGLSDERVFEFQVRAENAAGAGPWSPIEAGNIRKLIDPQFVSQAGIPARIGIGQSFAYTQIWKNNGAETWVGGAHGTGPFNPADTSVWATGVVAFPGSTATGASVTASLTAVAPATAGTYPLQRVMQKSGTAYGSASTAASVIVVGTPSCTAATPDATTTYNANGTITVTLQGASSVESASIKVWGNLNGQDDVRDYAMTLGGNWTATFPVANHLSDGETGISVEATVANPFFAPVMCATSGVTFQQLPVPQITLIPTMGSYTDGAAAGFVASRASGEYAKATVDLGSYTGLKAKVELVLDDQTSKGVNLNNLSPGTQVSLSVVNSVFAASVPAWTRMPAFVKVTYADPAAASQGKQLLVPVSITVPPVAMQVTASGAMGLPVTVNARVHNANAFDEATYGQFVGGLRLASDQSTVQSFIGTDGQGQWVAPGLDYTQLHSSQLVAVARVVPPAGVSLLTPMEFLSAPFMLPVQAPATVDATDGTREDDVKVNWTAVATGSTIRYRLFRDDAELTPSGGVSVLEFVDTPPIRGTAYNYRVKTIIGVSTSDNEGADTGFVPACRAVRLIGASLNADMSAINGLLERWDCLSGLAATSAIDAQAPEDMPYTGSKTYRSFSVPVPTSLADGAHVLHLAMESAGVTINASRTYDVPFSLDRASISVNSLTILYDGSPATDGLNANSIGRFGVRMEGGDGIGFAEEIK